MKSLTIKISVDEALSDTNLILRYILVDTLEEREIGEVWDEGMGETYMKVSLYIKRSKKVEKEIRSILQSLDLLEKSELIYSDI